MQVLRNAAQHVHIGIGAPAQLVKAPRVREDLVNDVRHTRLVPDTARAQKGIGRRPKVHIRKDSLVLGRRMRRADEVAFTRCRMPLLL